MKPEDVAIAREVVGKLADMSSALNAGDMTLSLRVAQLYLAEFGVHLASGKGVEEALLATAKPSLNGG